MIVFSLACVWIAEFIVGSRCTERTVQADHLPHGFNLVVLDCVCSLAGSSPQLSLLLQVCWPGPSSCTSHWKQECSLGVAEEVSGYCLQPEGL